MQNQTRTAIAPRFSDLLRQAWLSSRLLMAGIGLWGFGAMVAPPHGLAAQQAVLQSTKPGNDGLAGDQPVARWSHVAESSGNMVASVHPLATEAGLQAFAAGGNAIDAAIATALTLGVVDGFNSGIGGGCFILLRLASGEIVALDGREMAPAGAFREMFFKDGKPQPELSQTGPLAIGVPGSLAAYHQALNHYGKLRLSDLLLPAAELAEQGFAISEHYAGKLRSEADQLNQFPASREIFFRDQGSPYQAGEKLLQPDLARTYRQIAESGSAWFYNGEFANKVEQWSREQGGVITARDFANYQVVARPPIRSRYRQYEVIGFPPPSSGGVHVAQILNILENFELKGSTEAELQQSLHLVAEAMKLAFADRAYWLGDPDYVKVPRGLVDKAYARELAMKINLRQATPVLSHGNPPNPQDQIFERHTTHLTAADQEGNWVAITATVNTTFGSKVVIPGTGVVMNNQMDDFSIAPGIPNAFGLIGGENNSVAAGKRPLSSMSPTIVLYHDQPLLTVGAAGGPMIISQTLWTIVQYLDFGYPLEQAIAGGRIHHQWSPDRLRIENTWPQTTVEALKERGHAVEKSRTMGVSQAIAYDPQRQIFIGVADPRVGGAAAGAEKVPNR
jgi:gamma-glutamyltranspeptidase/glutathione hydrolase